MSFIYKVIEGKCPKCGEGDVFQSKGNIFLFQTPKMNEKCQHCCYVIEKEPGYFLGAFYVSYGMAVLELVTMFLLLSLLTDSVAVIISVMLIVLILLSFFNFRISRLIWIQTFNK